jgi:hypothetical protein
MPLVFVRIVLSKLWEIASYKASEICALDLQTTNFLATPAMMDSIPMRDTVLAALTNLVPTLALILTQICLAFLLLTELPGNFIAPRAQLLHQPMVIVPKT